MEDGEAYVIPITLRPAGCKETPLGELQVLPTGAQAITTWEHSDEAFIEVAEGIKEVLRKLTNGTGERALEARQLVMGVSPFPLRALQEVPH